MRRHLNYFRNPLQTAIRGWWPRSAIGFLFASTLLVLFSPTALAEAYDHLTDVPLEDLLNKEVVTASKLAQQISDSPSAVSIVTAKDIQAYGYRTLAEIIASMRGLNTVNDHVYTYMSGRGFGVPGDYAGRIMLLIDGHQANDNLYNSSYLGNDGLLDTELIDRVEYVSGPGAVIYGNGAFYGIINIITKKSSDFNATQVAVDAASHQGYKERITYGNQFENGADVLISASHYRSQGQNLYFSAFDTPQTNFGVAKNLDQENNYRLFFKGNFDQWSLESAYVTRTKDDPAASYEADFNVKPSEMTDMNAFINLTYQADLSNQLKTAIKTYYGQYMYHAGAVYSGEQLKENDMGRWWGVESKFVYSGLDQHKIVYGLEYRNDYQQDFYIYTGNINQNSYMASAYIQDEYRVNKEWAINLGVRGDYDEMHTHNVSPRAAIIYSPMPSIDIKASYASAFRKPTANERYWTDNGDTQLANVNLKEEKVQAFELVGEYRPDNTSRWMSSLYHYNTKHLIESYNVLNSAALQYANDPSQETTGFDFEYTKRWNSKNRLTASYAWQLATDEFNKAIPNIAKNQAKLNYTQGLFNHDVYAGIELQYIGARLTEQEVKLGSYTICNLTLHSTSLIKNTTVSVSIKNLFDHDYTVPSPSFYTPQTFTQDGRNFWFQMTYDFKK
jgi:outer membrane receptor for ferrienterochelin and colicins